MSELVRGRANSGTPATTRGRSPSLSILLILFAACVATATVISLALGLDLLVAEPELAVSLDLPGRLQAIEPFRVARWPFDAVSTLGFVVGFAVLALAADPVAALAEDDHQAGVLRSAILATGVIGAASRLLYLGATHLIVTTTTCDCGNIAVEEISRFWAAAVVEGATDWLGYGAVAFGAFAVALSARAIRLRRLPRAWPWIAWAASLMLTAGIAIELVGEGSLGDLVLALATGLLLPVWALLLARAARQDDAVSAWTVA